MEVEEFDSQPKSKNNETKTGIPATDSICDSQHEEKFEPVQFKDSSIRSLKNLLTKLSSGYKMKIIIFLLSEFDLTSGWETLKCNVDINQSVTVLDFTSSDELPLTQGEDGEQVFNFK